MTDKYEFQASNIRYGRCQGGPYDQKDLAHHAEAYNVALDMHTRKARPGLQSSTDPAIKFGTYRYVGKEWIWQDDSK